MLHSPCYKCKKEVCIGHDICPDYKEYTAKKKQIREAEQKFMAARYVHYTRKDR